MLLGSLTVISIFSFSTDSSSWWLHRFMFRPASVSRPQDGTCSHPIRPSCITFQPTFPTVSTQKDWRTERRIHFSWRLENGLLWCAESLEITHPNPSVTLHWSIEEFQLKDQNCSGQTDGQWWSHTSTLWSDVNANWMPKWPLELISFPVRSRKCCSVWLLACVLIPLPDFSASIPPYPPF